MACGNLQVEARFRSEITVDKGTKRNSTFWWHWHLIGMEKHKVQKHKVLGFTKKDLGARRAGAMLP